MKVVAMSALRRVVVRTGFTVLPVVSLGLLCNVPSLVLALRRRSRADWWAFAGFSAVLVAWITDLGLTSDDTHGVLFTLDMLLILLSMMGASVHAWMVWPRRVG
ncbi:hypothetical protein AB0I51_43845 [Streptomyces sp. NPDC050549]|uniref:hypothetical protein n=1 Tax=Streptomyces sp. NPDC050549 TaxID=3155406 RepID=UPI003436B5BE